jgi:hypothetical protein
MSDMTIFEGMGNTMPAHLAGGELSETAKALAGGGGGGQSLKRISFKGSVFRMMLGSEEIAQNEDRAMNMIVVKSAPAIARTYYEGSYKEGVISSPACWSDDGNAPSSNVESPQASLCANCPQNVKGSGQGDSRACRYSARLAVVLEGDQKGDVYGVTLPATSVFGKAEDGSKYAPLQAYVRKLAEFGFDIVKVVTEVKFDTKSPVPKLMFRAVRPLNEDEWATAQEKANSSEAKAHTGERQFTKRESEEELKAKDGFEKPVAEQKAEAGGEEPKVVKKKAEPAQAEKADVASILDEWGDE